TPGFKWQAVYDLMNQRLEAVSIPLQFLIYSFNRSAIVRFQPTPECISEHLLYECARKLRELRRQHSAHLGRGRKSLAVRKCAACIDREIAVRVAPFADSVEVFEAET